jgi:DNA repair protein RecO (recombination protein O)
VTSKLGALEPIHELCVVLELTEGRDLAKLAESKLSRPRLRVLESIERLEAFGRMARWVRGALAPLEPEPRVFDDLSLALDLLDGDGAVPSVAIASELGMRLLGHMGYALELESCVRCTTMCPVEAAALFDPIAGGIVCRACGGGPILLRAAVRRAMRTGTVGVFESLATRDAALVLDLIDRAIEVRA